MSHCVNQREMVNSGGSGTSVRISAGVLTSGRRVSTGGGVRDSATAAPLAMPMNTSSSVTRPQNRRDERSPLGFSSRWIREISPVRYRAPSAPISSSATTFTPTVIGPAQGYDETTDWTFDEIDVAFEGNNVDSGAVIGVDYLTDQAHYSTLMAAQQTSTAYGATYQLKEQRAVFGINGHGAWIRPRIQLSSTARMALRGWSVLGFPVADTVGVA